MKITKFFEALGAPLRNSRWSWGAVRSDGAVILRVWEDQVERFDGSAWVRVGRRKPAPPRELGRRERLAQIELINKGAACFVVMCKARDIKPNGPREILSFNDEQLFRAGKIVERTQLPAKYYWIELNGVVPVQDLFLRHGKHRSRTQR